MKVWKEKASRKKWALSEVSKMKELFYLQGWEVPITFFHNEKQNSNLVSADMTTTWKYRRAELNLYPCFWNGTDEDRREILIHEFTHVLIARVFTTIDNLREGFAISANEIEDLHEDVTSWVASIISKNIVEKE